MSAPLLHARFPPLAGSLPFLRLGTGPTPVRELEPGLWVKDEGAYGDGGWGGNKVRKLEWILPDARRRGRRTVLTFGALGTNHGLATALYAPRAGMHAAVAVVDQPLDDHVRANLARALGRILRGRDLAGAPGIGPTLFLQTNGPRP